MVTLEARLLWYTKEALLGCKTGSNTLQVLPEREVYFPNPWICRHWELLWLKVMLCVLRLSFKGPWEPETIRKPSPHEPGQLTCWMTRDKCLPQPIARWPPDNASEAILPAESWCRSEVSWDQQKFPADPSPSCELKNSCCLKPLNLRWTIIMQNLMIERWLENVNKIII